MTKTAAIIGGGVIGGGWAARFLLNGWDVRVFDPDPEAERKISEVLSNARASYPGLCDSALPPEGALSFHDTMSDAVAGASWIQESVPERLEIKHGIYAEIEPVLADGAIVSSSASGLTLTQMQAGATRPEQIVVAHPFNPVYLLPLVELVGSEATPDDVLLLCKNTLKDVGMYPLHVKAEIDAHIADRFLEAVWREALWLINDGIATTEEIDEAIRMGFGLRWAQMGLFETYRIAGGEAGMKHFIEQFGPALAWPWTKLMDVPELTPELVEKIAGQSDAQSGRFSIRELEAQRDANLVGMMRALKARDFGAGAVLNAADTERDPIPVSMEGLDLSAPVETGRRAVPLDWTDYNGHMNEARYLTAFADATDRLMLMMGCGPEYIAEKGSFFTVETHIRHLDEIHAGQVISIKTQVLQAEGKKLHLFHEMWVGERLCASGEHMLLHVSLETRATSVPVSPVAENMAAIHAAHSALPKPDAAGAAIGKR